MCRVAQLHHVAGPSVTPRSAPEPARFELPQETRRAQVRIRERHLQTWERTAAETMSLDGQNGHFWAIFINFFFVYSGANPGGNKKRKKKKNIYIYIWGRPQLVTQPGHPPPAQVLRDLPVCILRTGSIYLVAPYRAILR